MPPEFSNILFPFVLPIVYSAQVLCRSSYPSVSYYLSLITEGAVSTLFTLCFPSSFIAAPKRPASQRLKAEKMKSEMIKWYNKKRGRHHIGCLL